MREELVELTLGSFFLSSLVRLWVWLSLLFSLAVLPVRWRSNLQESIAKASIRTSASSLSSFFFLLKGTVRKENTLSQTTNALAFVVDLDLDLVAVSFALVAGFSAVFALVEARVELLVALEVTPSLLLEASAAFL